MKKAEKNSDGAGASGSGHTSFKWMQCGKNGRKKEHSYRRDAVPGRGCLYQQYPFQSGGKGEGI